MDSYQKFDLARNIPKRKNSPYWRFTHDIHSELNRSSNSDFMWSNLVRFDHQRARAEADVEATFTILLRKEIEILRPDVVLFLTGPEYDSSISKAFTGVIILTLSPRFELRQLAWLKHQELPETTFRTYHPGFLNRKPWRDAVKAEIVRAANIDQKFRQ